MKASITQRLVSSIKSKASVFDVADDKLTGFILRVYPSGKRIYYVRPRRGSMRKIGDAPAFTPAQAREVAKKVIQAVTTGDTHPVLDRHLSTTTNPTLEHFIDAEYRPHFEVNHRNTKNLDNLNVLGSLRKRRLSEITAERIGTWRAARRRQVTSATVNRNVSALSACLSFAVDQGHIDINPLMGAPKLQVEQPNRVRYLDEDEEGRLRETLDAVDQRLRTMVLLSLNTGLRQGELFGLQWENVRDAVVTVESGKSKSRKTRHIPLNREAQAALKAWGNPQPIGYVFPGIGNGSHVKDVRKAWGRLLKRAKVTGFHWHDMRHHFASMLVMGGRALDAEGETEDELEEDRRIKQRQRAVPLNTVRELLGHSDIKMTLRYAHLAPGHMREAVEVLDG